MNAWTAVITSSGFLESGRADETTWSIICFLKELSTERTNFQRSFDCLFTKYWAWILNNPFLLVQLISYWSQSPGVLL
jgi:hypothetical protein